MTTVRFTLPMGADGFQVEYGWDGPVPMPGEAVCFDGSDPAAPEGTYYVKHRWFDVSLRGLQMVDCVIRGPAENPVAASVADSPEGEV